MPKVRSIRLVNCQSHRDTKYEMSPGLNVIVATNNTGKSVLFKMLKIAVNPEHLPAKKRAKLIRDFCECAMTVFDFDDDTCGVVAVYPKSVLYYFSEDGKTFSAPATQPDQRMLDGLAVITDRNSTFFGNIIDLDQGMLFVNSHNRSNFDLIKMLTSDIELDMARVKIENKIAYFESQLPTIMSKSVNLELKKGKTNYVDIESLESSINNMESLLLAYESMIMFVEQIELAPVLKSYSIDFDKLLMGLELVEGMQNMFDSLGEVKEIPDTVSACGDLIEDLYSGLSQLEKIKQDTSVPVDLLDELLNVNISALINYKERDYDSILKDLELLELIQSIGDSISEAVDAQKEYVKSSEELHALNKQINALGQEVPCVIYGKVVHADGICIPYSE